MKGLTQRQTLVLDVIRASITEHGFPPTIREISTALGGMSTNGVHEHLAAIERKGHIERARYQARSIRLVDAAPVTDAARIQKAREAAVELLAMPLSPAVASLAQRVFSALGGE